MHILQKHHNESRQFKLIILNVEKNRIEYFTHLRLNELFRHAFNSLCCVFEVLMLVSVIPILQCNKRIHKQLAVSQFGYNKVDN